MAKSMPFTTKHRKYAATILNISEAKSKIFWLHQGMMHLGVPRARTHCTELIVPGMFFNCGTVQTHPAVWLPDSVAAAILYLKGVSLTPPMSDHPPLSHYWEVSHDVIVPVPDSVVAAYWCAFTMCVSLLLMQQLLLQKFVIYYLNEIEILLKYHLDFHGVKKRIEPGLRTPDVLHLFSRSKCNPVFLLPGGVTAKLQV
jgi:hypothetical protein